MSQLLVLVALFGCPQAARPGLHERRSPDFLDLRLLVHASSPRAGFRIEVSFVLSGPWVSGFPQAHTFLPSRVRTI